MRLLHTSDWHLGKRLGDFSRHEEQVDVLDEICMIADEYSVDAVLIAGDLFDNPNPPAASLDLFYSRLKKLSNGGKRVVVAIAGNHDSAQRIESPVPLARECGILLAGYPDTHIPPFSLEAGIEVTKSLPGFIEIMIATSPHPLRLITTAYANELRMKTRLSSDNPEEEFRDILEKFWNTIAVNHCDEKGVNVLLSHLFVIKKGGEVPEEPDDEKPILHVGGAQAIFTENIPKNIQYTALGHLHNFRTVDTKHGAVVYSGSPIAYSFKEGDRDKHIVIAEILPGAEAEVKAIKLKSGRKLLQYKAKSVEDALIWLRENHNSLVEISIVSDTYLNAEDRIKLNDVHKGIISIIPEIKGANNINEGNRRIDLSKTTEELFIDYFKSKHLQNPDEEIIQIFREVMAEGIEDTNPEKTDL